MFKMNHIFKSISILIYCIARKKVLIYSNVLILQLLAVISSLCHHLFIGCT